MLLITTMVGGTTRVIIGSPITLFPMLQLDATSVSLISTSGLTSSTSTLTYIANLEVTFWVVNPGPASVPLTLTPDLISLTSTQTVALVVCLCYLGVCRCLGKRLSERTDVGSMERWAPCLVVAYVPSRSRAGWTTYPRVAARTSWPGLQLLTYAGGQRAWTPPPRTSSRPWNPIIERASSRSSCVRLPTTCAQRTRQICWRSFLPRTIPHRSSTKISVPFISSPGLQNRTQATSCLKARLSRPAWRISGTPCSHLSPCRPMCPRGR